MPLLPGPAQLAAPAAPTYRKTTAKTVNTTVGATDLLNGEINIPAGVMGSQGVCRLTAWGDWLQNSGGGSAPPRFQLLLGGTTLLDTGTTANSVAASATRAGWRICAEIMNTGSAAAQLSSLLLALAYGTPGAVAALGNVFTTGEGYYNGMTNGGGIQSGVANGINTTTVNTAVTVALVLNTINGSASATYETKLLGALVEII